MTAHEAFCQFLELSGLEHWVSPEAEADCTTYVVGSFHNQVSDGFYHVEGATKARGYVNFCAEAVFKHDGALMGFYVWE